MATSDEWSRVGFSGNPVTGNPDVVEAVTKELRELGDLAGRVSAGLDTLLTKAEDGGFEGRTADALRGYVKKELKTFMENVSRSFDLASSATARYARALGDARASAENSADTVAALDRFSDEPLAADDPEMTRAKNEVDAEIDAIQAEAKILEDALHEASRMVSRPIKPPKKSFWKRFIAGFFKALEILTLVLTLIAVVVTGPIGLVAFGLGAVLFVKALVDYAMGNGNALSLGLAFLGILFPSTKGLTTVGGLARMTSAGAKSAGGFLARGGRALFRGGSMLLSNPRALLTLTGQGLAKWSGRLGGLGMQAFSGLSRMPRAFAKAPGMLSSAMRLMPGFARGVYQQGRFALRRDFFMSTAFVSGSTAGRLGVYTVINAGRLFDFAVSAVLPLRYSELARFGFKGAFRMGILERGLMRTPRTVSPLTRTGTLGADLAELTGRGLTPGSVSPFGDTTVGKLITPGTPAFNDTLDDLAELTVPPATLPGAPGVSSLPRLTGSVPVTRGLDDLGVRLNSLDTLDTAGLPVGTLPGGQRLNVLNPLNGGLDDDLVPLRLRTALNTFDEVDEFGAPIAPGAPSSLLPPRNAVNRLQDLDALAGLGRTDAGLLKPLDDLADLSFDGKLGGLTEFQVRQILDGEIDLVNVTPDGVVLRIGQTDPVDVRVQLKDEVTVTVLGPADTRVPTLTSPTNPGRLDDLGIKLDDLARLVPDTTDGTRTARELLGLGPTRTDLVAGPVPVKPDLPPLTLREIVTGGATGKLATDRFQAWIRTQTAQGNLDLAGRGLTELGEMPPLSRARAELDLSAAKMEFDQARIAFDRLGMNLDAVSRDVTVMTTRLDGPVANLPTGELRLLDDLGRPTGQWITMEPGANVNWVLRTDAGIVPDVRVDLTDGGFTVTAPDGIITRIGPDGRSLGEVVLPAPGGLDRLFAAADRSVDVQAISPAPVWRETDETLWRIGGKRGLDQIFDEGFRVRDPLETNLDVMVRTGQPSAFVSTTADQNLIWDGIFKFEIEAPGGIDVGRTFERAEGTEAWKASGWQAEREIAFPGGIAPKFIRGAYRMDAQHNLVEWIPNPNFAGSNPLPDLAADLKLAPEGPSGISALDFQGLSVDDQLRLLDQLDLGDVNSLGGIRGLDDVGGELDSGYLSDAFSDSFQLDRLGTSLTENELRLFDPGQSTGLRMEWESTPRTGGGVTLTEVLGDVRLQYTADDALEFTELRVPGRDTFVQFDAAPELGSLPRLVGPDGTRPAGGGDVVIDPVRGALGVVTGVEVRTLDGAWTARFDLDGTRLSEQLTLSGLTSGGPLAGGRVITTFTQLPGGGTVPSFRVTVPGLGDGAFTVVRLDGDLAQRLPGGVMVTDTATGGRFVFDRGGQFVDLSADGAPMRLDASGATVPETTVGAPTNLDGLGGSLPLTHTPGNTVLDDAATDLTGLGSVGERLTVESLDVPVLPRVAPPAAPAPPPIPAPPRVAPPPVPVSPQVRVPDVPVPPRTSRAAAPGFETSFPTASIGTESELSGFVVALPGSSDRTFAFVSKVDTNEPLVMVTKDMSGGAYRNPADLTMAQRGNWQTHTVELVTYPSRLGDQAAIGARNDATQFLLDVFKDRLGAHNHQPLESMTSSDGRFALHVTNDRHVIAAGTGLELEGRPVVSMPLTGQQATIGIRAVDFGSSVTDELKALADNAHWYRPAFRNDDALRTALSREPLDAPAQVENAYTYVKSVVDFMSGLVNRHGIAIDDWAGAAPYRGLTDPVVKNEWGVLPRTRPSLILDSLSPGDRAVTLRLLRETPAIGNESIWKAVRQYILNGDEVAGHGINNATIGGERALLFEFRTVPDQLRGVMPREKAPVVVVSDPLAQLGSNRVAAVQEINKFVSGPGNKDAFADWYRAEFPKDPDAARIYQNRDADWIVRTAAARHKAEWISLHHPQTWQEITAKPVSIQMSAPAVSSAPPVVPHVGAAPLPDELGRPLSLGGPDTPPAPLPQIAQAPVLDLSGATALRELLDSPVPPVSPVREVPLSGLDDLTGLRLRVTEIPATDAAPASVRSEVLDFTAPGGPVRLPDAQVTVREGGGFTITGQQGGVRLQFDAGGHLEFRELPLNGTDFSLRFTDEALRPIQVVGPDGISVPGAAVTPVRDASGALSELTVRVPMPGTDGLTALWRFEPGGLLREQELPLNLPGLDGPSGLGVKVTVTPGTGGTTTRVLELTGPQDLTDSFRLTSVDDALAGRLPNGFTVTDTATDSRFHFDTDGRLAVWDLPAQDGSGLLRFTEGAAPDTPPVRLTGPEFSDLGVAERALGDDLWNRLVQDVRPVSADELNRAVDPDSPRTDTLSDAGDLTDLDLEALRARLDNLRQMDGPLSRTDAVPGSPDQLNVPLTGVDDLADFDLRVTRLPVTDATPPGSYRLELADRAPGGAGPVRASDFTVELLDDSHRFVVIDPAGTTRFTFGPDGRFLGRETVLAVDGLPEGLRLNVSISPGADGAGRVTIDVLVPAGAADSVRFAPASGPLAGRLPSGVTLTTETGSRFHFDHTGRLAFRDLPAEDGSGFLRFTEGAPDTPPIRLDDLGNEIGGSEHAPLGRETGAPESFDFAGVFDRMLDEASGFRTLPEGAPADLSDAGRVMDFLEPDAHVVQSLDLPGVQRLADGATESLNRFGLRPDLLGDQLRTLTAETRLALRQQAVTTLGEYLNLPLATRLDDLQSVAQGGAGRVMGDFTVSPTPLGGPGGSRYTVVHNPSDVTLGFGPNRELVHQEVFLRGGPGDLDGLKLGITGRASDGGPWTPSAFDIAGTHPFTITDLAPTAPHDLRGGFTITDAAGTTSWHYGPEGIHALRDVQLPGDRGILRFDAAAPDGVPQILDSAGHQLPGLRPEFMDNGRIALVPTGNAAQPLERALFDPAGKLLEETVAIRGKGGRPTGEYWKIDHVSGTAVRTDTSGTPLTGRFDTATVDKSPTGQFKLTGAQPGKVTLFERETLKNGNVVHVSRDRFGHARWTEFDSPGHTFRHGERIGDADMRTFHDVPSDSWRRLVNNSGDVRTYTKGIDGGLVRAEKSADGNWTWQRFDKEGTESLSGTRQWSWDRVGFKDTYLDPATGVETVAQRRGRTWPFGGEHGSRMYQEYAVVPGHAPAGGRVAPDTYTGFGAANAQIESLETLADGGSLLVKRYADMRPPAFLWKGAAGRSPFEGFFRDLFAGDSLHRVSHWTQTAADGTQVTGVRLNPTGSNWVDIDQYGRIVRETRKLDGGSVIEVGRSLDDPTRWAPLPEYRKGGSYELSWRDTTNGTTGTRHIDGYGRRRDIFTDELGVDRVRLRSEGRGTREYLFEAPSTRDLAVNDNAGVWVDRNSLLHVTGRRDVIGGQVVESSGDPYRTSWTWRAYAPDDPSTLVAEGVRKQNRGSFYSKTWDDSFVDLDGLGNPVRERNVTDTGSSWVDAVKQPDGGWKWTKTAADGTVHSEGTRVYDDFAGGRWRDTVDGQTVRQRDGGRVREFDYELVTPEPPTLTTTTSLRDLLAQAAHRFEPPTTVRVNPDVWKEYDLGKVFRERVAVDGAPGRFREVDKQWGQWREFQDGHLVEQRTFTGRVWKTDAFGRWSTSGPAMLPEYLAGALPRMGDEIGLSGDRGWQLIGRETDFRGAEIEALGLLREVQDPWHGVFTGVREGMSAEMPVWQRELRATLTTFSTTFVTDFTASLLISELTNNGNLKSVDYFKALLNGAVGGTFSGGLNVLYNRTALGYFKNSMGARDWGAHPKQSMAGNTDDWATDWAAQEKPTRWRNATYANTVGLTTSALSGFVSNAISASVFGVNGNEVKGVDALLAGGWGAAGSLFSGVTTGLARNVWHLTTGARVFHKGGLGELGMNWAESALTRYLVFEITEEDKRNGNNLPSPGRAFPTPATTTPPAEPPQSASDPAAIEGLELL